MSNLLDQVLQAQEFTPSTIEEYLALQLAKRLDDETKIRSYIQYVGRFSAQHLVRLFHRAKQRSDPARAFHSFLTEP